VRIRVGPETVVHAAAILAVPVLVWFFVDPESAGPILGWLLIPLLGIPVLSLLLLGVMAAWKRWRKPPPPTTEDP
jgi:hypothetical protein